MLFYYHFMRKKLNIQSNCCQFFFFVLISISFLSVFNFYGLEILEDGPEEEGT